MELNDSQIDSVNGGFWGLIAVALIALGVIVVAGITTMVIVGASQ